MKKPIQMSESLPLGIVLALSGGFMDAYSYICRDGVFANAQTGNMLLFGVHLAQGDWTAALSYFCPVLFFALGMIISILVRRSGAADKGLHWRQVAVLFEAAVLAGVCFIPQSANLIANSLISLACGIQLESFTKIRGSAIATTMCIGNLRVATENLCGWLQSREVGTLKKAALYFGIICCFVTGAVLGDLAVKAMGEYALLICSALLIVVFFMMFAESFSAGGRKNGNK